VKITMLCKYR